MIMLVHKPKSSNTPHNTHADKAKKKKVKKGEEENERVGKTENLGIEVK